MHHHYHTTTTTTTTTPPQETVQEIEARLLKEEASGDRARDRIFYEKQCEAKLQDVEDKMMKMREEQDLLRDAYERRYHQHVHVEKQDPDTLDMDPQQRAMRREIKQMQTLVATRTKERKKLRKAQELEDKHERTTRAKDKLNSRKYFDYIDGYFGQETENEVKHDGITFDNEHDYLRFILPSKTVQRQEEMARLKKMQVEQTTKQQFHEIDADHSGFIDKKEMRLRIKDIVGHPVSEEQLEVMFSVMDTDGNGQIDMQEFMDYCANELQNHDDWWDVENHPGNADDHDLTEACMLKPDAAEPGYSRVSISQNEPVSFKLGDTHPAPTRSSQRDRGNERTKRGPQNKFSVQVTSPSALMGNDSVKTYVLNKDEHDRRYLLNKETV